MLDLPSSWLGPCGRGYKLPANLQKVLCQIRSTRAGITKSKIKMILILLLARMRAAIPKGSGRPNKNHNDSENKTTKASADSEAGIHPNTGKRCEVIAEIPNYSHVRNSKPL